MQLPGLSITVNEASVVVSEVVVDMVVVVVDVDVDIVSSVKCSSMKLSISSR